MALALSKVNPLVSCLLRLIKARWHHVWGQALVVARESLPYRKRTGSAHIQAIQARRNPPNVDTPALPQRHHEHHRISLLGEHRGQRIAQHRAGGNEDVLIALSQPGK
jgi:hypothetical protein